MKKLAAVCLLMCLLSGCMGRGTELKDLTVVQGIGVDADEDGEVKVSMQVFDAAKASGSASELSGNLTKVIEAKGKSVYEAIYKSAVIIGGEPFISQNRVIVLGEDSAKSGVKGIMDYFFRDHETRVNVTLAMCRGDAKDILDADAEMGLIPIETVERLIKTSERNLITPHTDAFSVLKPMHEAQGDYYITALKAETEQQGGEEKQSGEKSGGEEQKVSEEKKKVKTDGVGIFRDNMLAGYLDEEESKGLIWLNAKAKGGIVVVDYEPIGRVTGEILNAHKELSMHFEDGRPICDVSIKCALNVDEIQGGSEEKFTVEAIAPMQSAFNEEISKAIEKTLTRCVYDYNVDVFRLRDIMKNSCPQEFKAFEPQWHDFIKTIEFRLLVNTEIVRAGEEAVRK